MLKNPVSMIKCQILQRILFLNYDIDYTLTYKTISSTIHFLKATPVWGKIMNTKCSMYQQINSISMCALWTSNSVLY